MLHGQNRAVGRGSLVRLSRHEPSQILMKDPFPTYHQWQAEHPAWEVIDPTDK